MDGCWGTKQEPLGDNNCHREPGLAGDTKSYTGSKHSGGRIGRDQTLRQNGRNVARFYFPNRDADRKARMGPLVSILRRSVPLARPVPAPIKYK